jgi:hypothetical protein
MRATPRPAARVLLAGRFVVPRSALVALPDGPVLALDLTCGALVSLAFGPSSVDPGELAARIGRWNALERAGCPMVRELHWHLNRPLLASGAGATVDARAVMGAEAAAAMLVQAAAIGAALDREGLGLPSGSSGLALGAAGPWLRRPAIWEGDPGRPLARRLADDLSALLGATRTPEPEAVAPRRSRVRAVALPRVLDARRARVGLVAAATLGSAFVVSGLVGGAGAARAPDTAPLAAPLVSARVVLPALQRATPVVSRSRARPAARGGAARVLVVAAPPVVRVAAPTTRVASHDRPPRPRGWVEGLFVGG